MCRLHFKVYWQFLSKCYNYCILLFKADSKMWPFPSRCFNWRMSFHTFTLDNMEITGSQRLTQLIHHAAARGIMWKVRCPHTERFKRPLVTDEPVMFVSYMHKHSVSQLCIYAFLCALLPSALFVQHIFSLSHGNGNWAPLSFCQVWASVSPYVQQQTLK